MSAYEVLGIQASARDGEIRAAYKRLALQLHPDKGGSKAAFQRVAAAFEQLADPVLRKAYDERARLEGELERWITEVCKAVFNAFF